MTTLLLITSVLSMVVQNGLFGYVTKKKLRENRAILSFTIFAYGVCVIAIGLVCGVCTFAMNFINLKLSGLAQPAVFPAGERKRHRFERDHVRGAVPGTADKVADSRLGGRHFVAAGDLLCALIQKRSVYYV